MKRQHCRKSATVVSPFGGEEIESGGSAGFPAGKYFQIRKSTIFWHFLIFLYLFTSFEREIIIFFGNDLHNLVAAKWKFLLLF